MAAVLALASALSYGASDFVGPASVRDAQAWCGLSGLKDIALRLRPRLVAFRDDTGKELLDLPDAPRPDPQIRAPVRFLPPWDNVLRGHEDRTRVMSDEHRAALRRPNDVVPGTVLVDGFVAASWEQEISAAAATLTVQPMRRLSRRDAAAIGGRGPPAAALAGAPAQAGGTDGSGLDYSVGVEVGGKDLLQVDDEKPPRSRRSYST